MHHTPHTNLAADEATRQSVRTIRSAELTNHDVRVAEIITAAQLLSGKRMMSISAALDYLNDAHHGII